MINNKKLLISTALVSLIISSATHAQTTNAVDCTNIAGAAYISASNVCVGSNTAFISGGNTVSGNNARAAYQSSAYGNSATAVGPYAANWGEDSTNFDGNIYSTLESRTDQRLGTYRLNKVHGITTTLLFNSGGDEIGSTTYNPAGPGTLSTTYNTGFSSEDSVDHSEEYYSVDQKSTANYLNPIDFYQDYLSNSTGSISPFSLLGKDWGSAFDNERGSVAMGYNALATFGSNAIGNNSVATNYSNALGAGSFAQNGSSAIGYYSQALNLSNAMGYFAYAEDGSVAIGALSQALNNSVALGSGASATAVNSVALGSAASATAANSVALGSAASATAANSVALGFDSIANRANTVSVGSVGSERQITNVAPGTQGTDAVNLNQLNKVESKATSGIAMAMAMGGGANIPQGKNNAFTMAVGAFDTQQAVAASYATVVSPNAQINASVGYGMGGESQLGARIGTTFSW